MRIVYDASGMNVCMYGYSGVCTPRVSGAWRVLSTSRSKPRTPLPPTPPPRDIVGDQSINQSTLFKHGKWLSKLVFRHAV